MKKYEHENNVTRAFDYGSHGRLSRAIFYPKHINDNELLGEYNLFIEMLLQDMLADQDNADAED